MKITTQDEERAVYSDDSITTCTFSLSYETAVVGQGNKGSGGKPIEGGYAKADNGIFEYTNIKVFAEPGSIVTLKLKVENWAKYSYGKPPPYVEKPLHMVLYV